MSKRLYVGNLSFDTSEDDLARAFAPWGGTGAAIPTDRGTGRCKGFGFVEVQDDQMNAAISAMNGKDVGGRALTVSEARPREDRGGGESQSGYRGGGGGRNW